MLRGLPSRLNRLGLVSAGAPLAGAEGVALDLWRPGQDNAEDVEPHAFPLDADAAGEIAAGMSQVFLFFGVGGAIGRAEFARGARLHLYKD